MNIPSEFSISGVYLHPFLIAAILGVITAVFVGRLLNSYRLANYFFYTPVVFVAFVMIFTVIHGILIIPF
ncbi:MAG: DUF1656 domain-containing protein [Gammaproteobacteria bacterium]|nr:MAG: DUF1656 domain-containing protein [Gammaproteobacteria bacterium]